MCAMCKGVGLHMQVHLLSACKCASCAHKWSVHKHCLLLYSCNGCCCMVGDEHVCVCVSSWDVQASCSSVPVALVN